MDHTFGQSSVTSKEKILTLGLSVGDDDWVGCHNRLFMDVVE